MELPIATNALSATSFVKAYMPLFDTSTHQLLLEDTLPGHSIVFRYAEELESTELRACFSLVEETSRLHYETSPIGWRPGKKMQEMRDPDMRYLMVTALDGNLGGFLSFMITSDSEPLVPVLYIYEIHLSPALRGKGLGHHLLTLALKIAASVGVAKVMLSCFIQNTQAYRFYEAHGFAKDAISPADRVTRSQKRTTTFVILSRQSNGQRARFSAC